MPSSVVRIIPVRLFALSLLIFGSMPMQAYSSQPPDRIVVAFDEDYPPYSFIDDEGRVRGIVGDLWSAWSRSTGVQVELRPLPWAEALAAFDRGEADVLDTVFENAGRSAKWNFTPAYATIEVPVFVHRSISGIASPDDLKGFRVAVKTGDAAIDELRARGISLLASFDNYQDIVDAAVSLDVRIFCVDEPPALYYLYKKGVDRDFRIAFSLYRGAFHRAVHKDRPALLELVNRGFSSLPLSTRESINRKWLGEHVASCVDLRLVGPSLALLLTLLIALGFAAWMLRRRVAAATAELKQKVALLKENESALMEDIAKRTAVESALRDSEERFRIAFRESGMPKAIVGLDGRIVEVNEALCSLIGFGADELKGQPWKRFGHPEEYVGVADRVAEIVTGTRISDVIEARVVPRDGRDLWCLVNATVIRNTAGKRVHTVLELQDITERKNAETRLIKSEQRLSDLVEQSPFSYALYDEDGTCLMVNDTWSRFWGIPKDLPVGRYNVLKNTELIAGGMLPGLLQRLKSGEAVAIPELKLDIAREPFTGGSGNCRWVRGMAYPVMGTSGRLRMFVVLNEDITGAKAAESALRDSEARFRLLAENSTDMISRHSVDGTYLYASPACSTLLGYDPEQLVGASPFDFIHPTDMDAVRETLRKLLETAQSQTLRYRIRRINGAYIWFETISRTYGDPSTGTLEIQCASRDITERIEAQAREKEHEQQLYRASRLSTLGLLMSEVGHEVNNPNNYIRLNAQNLMAMWTDMRAVLDSAGQRGARMSFQGIPYETARGMVEDLLQGVIEGSRRIERLLVDLRDFARGDEGALDHAVDLNAAIKSALVIIGDAVGKATHHLAFCADADLPCVRGNFYQLEQAVINLVGNACQSLESPDRAIRVETRNEGRRITLIVADEGVGISAANLERLTEPFFTTKREQGGSGLGLAVTSRIIRNHGGTIEYASELGKGTTVTIHLPAMEINL